MSTTDKLAEALRMMLRQFTKTPSTLIDSEVRCAAHEALAAYEAEAKPEPAEPVALGPMARRRVFDAIRAAYDLGHSDRQNGSYAGREVEVDHGGALISGLQSIAYLEPPAPSAPAPAPAEPVPEGWETAAAVGDLMLRLSQWKATSPATAPPAWAALVKACRAMVTAADREAAPAAPAAPAEPVAAGRWMIRHNSDGEFGQATGWLYRDGGTPCAITGKPVYVWRKLDDLLKTTGHTIARLAAAPAAPAPVPELVALLRLVEEIAGANSAQVAPVYSELASNALADYRAAIAASKGGAA